MSTDFTITVWDISSGGPVHTIVVADRSSFATFSRAGQPRGAANLFKLNDKFITIVEQSDGIFTLRPVSDLLKFVLR